MDTQTIGRNIRRLRLEHLHTRKQLAQGLGVACQTVSKWETGATLPDVATLPRIAAFFGSSIDELFFGKPSRCSGAQVPPSPPVSGVDRDFLLKTYSQVYAPEAAPWNLSAENKYLEYRFARFFQGHFPVKQGAEICNIGIGAGEWDRFLSYQLQGGRLCSIDIDPLCCRQLREGLAFEGNPNPVEVICADAMALAFAGQFDIVTLVGSTVSNSGLGLRLVEQAMTFLRSGGRMFYQAIDPAESPDDLLRLAHRQGLELLHYEAESVGSMDCTWWCLKKA